MELVKKVSAASGMSEEEVRNRVEEKIGAGFSEEGALHIVAKELGISLVKKQERLRIENIVPGMQNVEVIGKVMKIFKKEFKTEKAEGSVANVYLSDETGSLRLVLWNDEIEKLSGISEGDVIQIKGFVRESPLGVELRIGKFGSLSKSDEEIKVTAERQYERMYISELTEGCYAELRAAFLQIFETKPFYEICPQCGTRIKEESEYKCTEHGTVEPDYAIVISGIIDDGTENIRAVLFGENAEKILGMNVGEARNAFMKKMDKSAIYSKAQLGKEYIIVGIVRRNKVFGRLEFIVNDIKNVNLQKEIQRLAEKLNIN